MDQSNQWWSYVTLLVGRWKNFELWECRKNKILKKLYNNMTSFTTYYNRDITTITILRLVLCIITFLANCMNHHAWLPFLCLKVIMAGWWWFHKLYVQILAMAFAVMNLVDMHAQGCIECTQTFSNNLMIIWKTLCQIGVLGCQGS